MTSLNELLKKKSCELRHVSTRVTLPNGQVFDEVDGQRAATQCAVKEGFVVDLKPDLQIGRVLDRLYISSQDVAADHNLLKQYGIVHILNVAGLPTPRYPGITYCQVPILDLPEEPLVNYLPECFLFINQAIENGSVLVHCNAGVSRSVSVVVAYLMSHHSMTYEAALNAVRQVRPAAKPNDGFVKQLQNYQQQFISTLAIHLLDDNVT